MSLLQVKGISFGYSDQNILNNINFNLKESEIISILGENGTGKSSLLKIIAGLMDPSQGEVFFDGEKVKGPSYYLVPGHKKIKMVFQDFALAKKQTVYENIYSIFPPIHDQVKKDKTIKLLKQLHLLHLSTKKVEELSGGEKQKLAFARALANEPKILLMDEPFSNLDAFIKEDIRNNIFNVLKELSISAIFITHDPAEAFRFSDKILIMRHGKIIRSGSPISVYNNPGNVYTAKLTGAVNIISKKAAEHLNLDNWSQARFIRPEQILITKENGVEAKVVSCNFLGPMFETIVKIAGGEHITIYNREPVKAGESIKLQINN